MDKKSLGRVEVKDADLGTVSARFAYFDRKDHDGDVTLKNAFADGKQVKISAYNHGSWDGALPVGKGTIRVDADGATLEGQFFMNTAAGRDTFEVVKQLGELGEWSYGFTVADHEYGNFKGERVRFLKSLDVFEVSPVLRGAGIDTRTLAAKSQGASFSGEAEAVLTAVQSFADRAAEVLAMRRAEGKQFGAESAELISRLTAQLDRLKALSEKPKPDDDEDEQDESESVDKPDKGKPGKPKPGSEKPDDEDEDDDAVKAWLRFVARKHGISHDVSNG